MFLSSKVISIALLVFLLFQCNTTEAQEKVGLNHILIAEADSFFTLKMYDDATAAYQKILVDLNTEHIEYDLYKSKFHRSKGMHGASLSDFQLAQAEFEEALTRSPVILKLGHVDYLQNLFTEAYHAMANGNDWALALEWALEGEALLYNHLKTEDQAELVYDIGFLYDRNKDYRNAIRYYKKSIALYETLPEEDLDLSSLALAYNNLGTMYAETGYFSQRKVCYLRAKELWESDPNVDKSNLITIYGNLMRLYRTYGDKDGAEELIHNINSHFDQWISEESFGKSGYQSDQKPALMYEVDKHRLNIMYADLTDDSEMALAHLDSLRSYYDRMPRTSREKYSSHLITSINSAAAILDDYKQQAIRRKKEQLLELALMESLDYGNYYYEMLTYTEYCKYWLFSENDVGKAIDYLDKALEIGRANDIREVNLLNIFLKKADLLQQLGDFPQAEHLVKNAFSLMLEEDVEDLTVVTTADFKERNSVYYINALKEVANIYRNQFLLTNERQFGDMSYHFYDLAVHVFQDYYQKGAYNPYLKMTASQIHEGLTELYIELGKTDVDSLLVRMENNSSQLIWREFESKYQHYLTVPDSLLLRHNMLRSELATVQSDSAVKDAIEGLESELEQNEARISSVDKNYLSFFSDGLDLNQLKKSLSGNRIMVRFRATDKKLFAFLVESSGVQVIDLGEKDPVMKVVEDYHGRIQSIRPDVVGLSTKLYDYLIRPLGIDIGKFNQMVIIPDGKLNFLAFESLRNSENDRLLVEEFAVSYSYSFKLWELQHHESNSFMARKAVAAFVPKYPQSYLANMEELPVTRGRLTHLEGALSEANFIVDRLGGEIFHEEAASKHRFLESIGKYQVYHFATHAVVDLLQYENSGIYFQGGETMSYSELYNMHFPAELVVLSACNTGIGKLESGEGLMSLSRALTYAGVKASVYSLWQVPDEETSVLMRSFYGFLDEGKDKEKALALAKRKFLADHPMKQHPFYWAGFVLNGNMEALPSETKWAFQWIYAICLVAVFTVLVMAVISYRRRVLT